MSQDKLAACLLFYHLHVRYRNTRIGKKWMAIKIFLLPKQNAASSSPSRPRSRSRRVHNHTQQPLLRSRLTIYMIVAAAFLLLMFLLTKWL